MPRLLTLGHVTRDETPGGDRLGGSATFATLAASRLGWSAAALTAAGPEFEPERELPGIEVFCRRSAVSTRFRNSYRPDGHRVQHLLGRADDVDPAAAPAHWRSPEAVLLAPVAAEVPPAAAGAFSAGIVGACGQGWLRAVEPTSGAVSPRAWPQPERDLQGVRVVFLSYEDVAGDVERARRLLALVPLVILTRGRLGAELHSGEGVTAVPGLPREEVDPTGAGDVFAASFLVGLHESGDPVAAAALACCAASCVVERPGTEGLGDRAEIERRLELRRQALAAIG